MLPSNSILRRYAHFLLLFYILIFYSGSLLLIRILETIYELENELSAMIRKVQMRIIAKILLGFLSFFYLIIQEFLIIYLVFIIYEYLF